MEFTATPTTKEGLMAANITSLHIERGRQMRTLVRDDIANRGLSFEASVDSLASYLGIDAESVKLGIAIANGADRGEV
jgi:hypothetical protein